MVIGHYTTMPTHEKTNYTFHIPEPCFEPVQVVFTDEHLLVVCKPSGLLSVPGRIVKDCVLNRMLVDQSVLEFFGSGYVFVSHIFIVGIIKS